MTRPTAIVYLDGFNFYKGQLESRPHNKWVNLESLFDRVLIDFQVTKIHYFAGQVRGSANPEDPHAPDRQATLFRAMETLDRVETHKSLFTIRPGNARLTSEGQHPEWVGVWKVQEKGSDVKLAVQLLVDAIDGSADNYVIVSGDSDLASAISVARTKFGARVGVLYPRQERNKSFEAAGVDFSLYLHPADVTASQFPDTVVNHRGRQIHRPREWKKLGPSD